MKALLAIVAVLAIAAGMVGYRSVGQKSTLRNEVHSQFPKVTDSELRSAEHIVLVRAVKPVGTVTHESGNRYTHWEMTTVKDFKGNAAPKLIVTSIDEDEPFRRAGEYVLFLHRSPSGWLMTVGGPQGRFDVKDQGILESPLTHEKYGTDDFANRFALQW